MDSGIIILGMHRSGTSCLAGMLQLAGFNLGLVDEWNPDNLRGNRENQSILQLNESVLRTSGGSWDHPPADVNATPEQYQLRDRILGMLAEGGRPWMFKDPRVLITLPFWMDVEPKIKMIGIIRNPLAVAESLNVRNEIPLAEGLRLWQHYNLQLSDFTRTHTIPLLYFIGATDVFMDAVKTALTLHFPEEIKQGILNLAQMRDFFSKDLISHYPATDHELLGQLIDSGLDADEARMLNSLWGDLSKRAINSPSPHARTVSKDTARHRKKTRNKENKTSKHIENQHISEPEAFAVTLEKLDELILGSQGQIALWRQGIDLFKKNNKNNLSDWIEVQLEVHPDEPFLLFELAKLNWLAGQYDKATWAAEKAADLAPGWLPPMKHLAQWFTKTEQWNNASSVLNQLSEYTGASLEVPRAHCVQLYFDLGDGFKELHSMRSEPQQPNRGIEIEFDLSNIDDINRLRLDPVNYPAVIHTLNFFVIDELGNESIIRPCYTNARYVTNSIYYFDSNDPQFHFTKILPDKGKPVRLKASFEILCSDTDALRAYVEILSKARELPFDETGVQAIRPVISDRQTQPNLLTLPSFISEWLLDDTLYPEKLADMATLNGSFCVDGGHIPKLAICYSGETRIYTLGVSKTWISRQNPSNKKVAENRIKYEFCRPVPRDCIIKIGVEYDMRLFWLICVNT